MSRNMHALLPSSKSVRKTLLKGHLYQAFKDIPGLRLISIILFFEMCNKHGDSPIWDPCPLDSSARLS